MEFVRGPDADAPAFPAWPVYSLPAGEFRAGTGAGGRGGPISAVTDLQDRTPMPSRAAIAQFLDRPSLPAS